MWLDLSDLTIKLWMWQQIFLSILLVQSKIEISKIFRETNLKKNVVVNEILIYRKAKLSLLHMLDAD